VVNSGGSRVVVVCVQHGSRCLQLRVTVIVMAGVRLPTITLQRHVQLCLDNYCKHYVRLFFFIHKLNPSGNYKVI
jgi:hypothetical protein